MLKATREIVPGLVDQFTIFKGKVTQSERVLLLNPPFPRSPQEPTTPSSITESAALSTIRNVSKTSMTLFYTSLDIFIRFRDSKSWLSIERICRVGSISLIVETRFWVFWDLRKSSGYFQSRIRILMCEGVHSVFAIICPSSRTCVHARRGDFKGVGFYAADSTFIRKATKFIQDLGEVLKGFIPNRELVFRKTQQTLDSDDCNVRRWPGIHEECLPGDSGFRCVAIRRQTDSEYFHPLFRSVVPCSRQSISSLPTLHQMTCFTRVNTVILFSSVVIKCSPP